MTQSENETEVPTDMWIATFMAAEPGSKKVTISLTSDKSGVATLVVKGLHAKLAAEASLAFIKRITAIYESYIEENNLLP